MLCAYLLSALAASTVAQAAVPKPRTNDRRLVIDWNWWGDDTTTTTAQAATTTSTSTSSGWASYGCYQDSPTRVLAEDSLLSDSVTPTICMNYCLGKGYKYAGLEYGRECYCGSQINKGTWYGIPPDSYISWSANYGSTVDSSNCQAMACAGDSSTYCGGHWKLSIYAVTNAAAATSAIAWSSSSSAAASKSTSLAQYSSSSAAAYSSSSSVAAYSSASGYSASSAAAYSSASAYSSSSAAAYASAAAAYSSSSSVAAAAASKSSSLAAYSSSSAAGYSSSSAAGYSASSAAAYSSSSSVAAAAASKSSSLAAYSSASGYSASSAAAYSSASAYSSSSAAAAYSASSSAAAYSAAAAKYSSAAAYSQSSAAAYSSSASAASSAAAYSSAAASYSSAAAAYSAAASSAAAYSASSSAAAYSSAAAAYSASASAAAYSASSSAAAYSASTSAAGYSASVASYSASVSAANAAASSAAAYSASTSAAGYSASVSAANAAASSAAAYSASTSAAGYSASVAAASSAAAYSASASAAGYSSSSAAAYSASSSAAAYSSSSSAAAAAVTAIPSGWSAAPVNAIAEGTTGRALVGASTSSSSMTWSTCINYCSGQGYGLAGIEYGSECYCGYILSNGASLTKTATATMSCSGAASALCGGPNVLTLFVSDSAKSELSSDYTSKPVALPSGWAAASTACVAEGTTGRALTGASTSSDSMTPNACATFCSGYAYAGVEYGRECYCGNSLTNGASLSTASTTCNMACSGNPSVICGGSNGLQLYTNSANAASAASSVAASSASASASAYSSSVSASAASYSASISAASATASTAALPTGWSSSGCITEVVNRALNGASTTSSSMTVNKCIAYCSGLGYSMAGLEYASECYCGNSLANGASLTATSSACTMTCSGDSSSTCGGPNGVQLYSAAATASSASSSASASTTASITASSTSTSASASKTSTGPTAVATAANGWVAHSTSCLKEVTGRALTGAQTASDDMTISTCTSYCAGLGFTLAGVEYGRECYCGNSLSNGASLSVSSSQCTMACGGDSTSLCGGPDAIQLYTGAAAVSSASSAASTASSTAASSTVVSSTSTTSSAAATSTVQTTGLASGWSVASTPCITEVVNRALAGASTTSSDMTVDKCISYCSGLGYTMAGLEYAAECYCGNALANGASLSNPSSSCTMACGGDSTKLCGGPNGVQLYVSSASTASTSSSASSSITSSSVASTPSASSTVASSSSASAASTTSVSASVVSASSTSSAASASATIKTTGLPDGWSAGSSTCLQEVTNRALDGYAITTSDMTVNKCLNICDGMGYYMAGIEYGGECHCGTYLNHGASLEKTSASCNMPCSGDSSSLCGGSDALQYYTRTVPKSVNGYSYVGCIQEVVGRALNQTSTTSSSMTLETCTSFCNAAGYKMAGLEYGSECYCGNSLVNGASTSLVSYQCSTTCSGNSNEICGGPDAISFYSS